jgi:hypothetical protein
MPSTQYRDASILFGGTLSIWRHLEFDTGFPFAATETNCLDNKSPQMQCNSKPSGKNETLENIFPRN